MNTIERCCATSGLLLLFLFVIPAISDAQTPVLPQACLDCHGSETKYPVRGARSQYLTSGHRNLGNTSYANSDDCQGCHTNEGFIERAKTGKVDVKKFVRYPRTPKNEVRARNIPTESWGAHHGPQADMLSGTNAYEYPEKKYSSSAHGALPQATCVTCHMALPNGRYPLAPSIGGHSFKVEGEVHEEPKVNNAGCLNSGCHSQMNQAKGTPYFDRKAPADYDANGKTETIQQEVEGLYERLINERGTGLLQRLKPPIYDANGKFIENYKNPYPVEVVGALYNYKFVKEDGSKGIDNTTYAVQLLMDAIKALDKSFDDLKRP